LLGVARSVFALADMVHFFADKLTSLCTWSLSGTRISARALDGFFSRHKILPARPASARDWPGHQSGLKFMSNGSQHAVSKSGIGVNKYARFVSLD
jgi:hypothetical protein